VALPLVLASASPRRRQLLAEAGLRFELAPAQVDESPFPDESPEALTRRLAVAKARAAARPRSPARVVLGADTLVVLGGEVLGKPRDAEQAVSHLSRLAGRTHRVLTAVALVRTDPPALRECRVESRVTLRPLSEREIREYVAGGEPLDKAGAYALQGEGRRFVEKVSGSESNVIGLPLEETLAALRELGIAP
jgi:septum formation protein